MKANKLTLGAVALAAATACQNGTENQIHSLSDQRCMDKLQNGSVELADVHPEVATPQLEGEIMDGIFTDVYRVELNGVVDADGIRPITEILEMGGDFQPHYGDVWYSTDELDFGNGITYETGYIEVATDLSQNTGVGGVATTVITDVDCEMILSPAVQTEFGWDEDSHEAYVVDQEVNTLQ